MEIKIQSIHFDATEKLRSTDVYRKESRQVRKNF